MTNGKVVVLGATGKNFAAGMSGGLAYVLDLDGKFEERCNKAMITLHRLSDPEEITTLKGIIYKHLELSESGRARDVLADWAKYEPLFWKVLPTPPALPPPATAPGVAAAPTSVPPVATPAASEPAKA